MSFLGEVRRHNFFKVSVANTIVLHPSISRSALDNGFSVFNSSRFGSFF
jgi:hypothetical protein